MSIVIIYKCYIALDKKKRKSTINKTNIDEQNKITIVIKNRQIIRDNKNESTFLSIFIS